VARNIEPSLEQAFSQDAEPIPMFALDGKLSDAEYYTTHTVGALVAASISFFLIRRLVHKFKKQVGEAVRVAYRRGQEEVTIA
jgi:hypothetical protein